MKKILIVEDDFYIRDIYSKTLIQAGYDTFTASDGEEAISLVQQQTYDMILLDIMLPKKNGIEVLKVFRSAGSLVINTPVFLITNLGQEFIIKEGFKLGADGYFLKAKLTPPDIVSELNAFFAAQENNLPAPAKPLTESAIPEKTS